MYTHTHTHTCIHINMYAYMHTYVYTNIDVCDKLDRYRKNPYTEYINRAYLLGVEC